MRLRPIRRGDAARIQRLVEDPAVRALTLIPDPYPPDGAEAWLDRELEAQAAGTAFGFAIATGIGDGDGDGDGLVGVCTVRDVGGEPPGGTLGYWVGRPYWGRGYASAAVAHTVAHAFGERHLGWLEASCHQSNAASRRILEKNGFRLVRRGPLDHPKFGPEEIFLTYRLER